MEIKKNKSHVTLFIEGGGDSAIQRTAFEKGWRNLLNQLTTKERVGKFHPRLVASGGRQSAWDDLCDSLLKRNLNYNYAVLVDAEDNINFQYSTRCNENDKFILNHLAERDGWITPDNYKANHVFLMVATMENWMLADPDNLALAYGPGFSLPNPPSEPEKITKENAKLILEEATKNCGHSYSKKVKDYEAFGKLDPYIIADKCPSFRHFIDCLPI